ncbi:MAG: polysaccharide pyruvyl transferase family protein [Bacteroidales bacterium]|nr:polysaccharide pyruvyl transferase family protein [Bacteroidales bacterium]
MSTRKKIMTITCHDVYNFGASLQAYALMRYLQDLGNEVEIVDYKPDYMVYRVTGIGKKWKKNIILKLLYYTYIIPLRLMLRSRRKKFDDFTRNELRTTRRKYNSYNELQEFPPEA